MLQAAASFARDNSDARFVCIGDGPAACYIGTSMLAQNPPEHTRLRRAVSKAFTAKAVEAMREQTVAKVNGLLDEVTAGRLGRKDDPA